MQDLTEVIIEEVEEEEEEVDSESGGKSSLVDQSRVEQFKQTFFERMRVFQKYLDTLALLEQLGRSHQTPCWPSPWRSGRCRRRRPSPSSFRD